MEPMIWSPATSVIYRNLSRRWELRPSSIHKKKHYFGEDPLYTRDSQLGILNNADQEVRSDSIISMAIRRWLDLEKALLRNSYHHTYALFLSVWEWEQDDRPAPSVFFMGSHAERLKKQLSLRDPDDGSTSPIHRILNHLGANKVAIVKEDVETSRGDLRFLIDFRLACNHHKMFLDSI